MLAFLSNPQLIRRPLIQDRTCSLEHYSFAGFDFLSAGGNSIDCPRTSALLVLLMCLFEILNVLERKAVVFWQWTLNVSFFSVTE